MAAKAGRSNRDGLKRKLETGTSKLEMETRNCKRGCTLVARTLFFAGPRIFPVHRDLARKSPEQARATLLINNWLCLLEHLGVVGFGRAKHSLLAAIFSVFNNISAFLITALISITSQGSRQNVHGRSFVFNNISGATFIFHRIAIPPGAP